MNDVPRRSVFVWKNLRRLLHMAEGFIGGFAAFVLLDWMTAAWSEVVRPPSPSFWNLAVIAVTAGLAILHARLRPRPGFYSALTVLVLLVAGYATGDWWDATDDTNWLLLPDFTEIIQRGARQTPIAIFAGALLASASYNIYRGTRRRSG